MCRELYFLNFNGGRIAIFAPYEEQIGDKKLFRVLAVASPYCSSDIRNLKDKMQVEVFYDGHLYYICKERRWKDCSACPPTIHTISAALINKKRQYKRMSKKITKICEKL